MSGDSLTQQAHRRHVYQLFANEHGIDHWKVSLGYGAVQLVIGIAVMMRHSASVFVLSFLSACFLCFALFSVRLRMKLIKAHHNP
ncbi:hypothetical protein JCM14469_14200 [Desulfatiferula olefinivorans]